MINETALLQRCNEWFATDAPSLTWACKMLKCSRETFKDKYAGRAVRVVAPDGTKQNNKWRVHPWDVLKLVDLK